jgi:hypothetical protein
MGFFRTGGFLAFMIVSKRFLFRNNYIASFIVFSENNLSLLNLYFLKKIIYKQFSKVLP